VADLVALAVAKVDSVIGGETGHLLDDGIPVVSSTCEFVRLPAGVFGLKRTFEFISKYRCDVFEIAVVLLSAEDFPNVGRCDTAARGDPRRSEVDKQRLRDRVHQYNSV